MDDVTGPTEDTGTSVSPLLPSGRGPLFEPGIGTRSEPVVGQLEPLELTETEGLRMLWRGWALHS